jgi:hypothetical protein
MPQVFGCLTNRCAATREPIRDWPFNALGDPAMYVDARGDLLHRQRRARRDGAKSGGLPQQNAEERRPTKHRLFLAQGGRRLFRWRPGHRPAAAAAVDEGWRWPFRRLDCLVENAAIAGTDADGISRGGIPGQRKGLTAASAPIELLPLA